MAIAKYLYLPALAILLSACATPSPADAALSAAVEQQINEEPGLESDHLTVQARNGTIYLNGLVDTAAEQAQAEGIAQSVPGVRHVVDMTGVRGNTF
ncbi:periplasmic protein [mine drainage metagenome]|uniref:Periplasmic protein n=1 Tax=mine drainage metagenome TaxID=410659 RepID=A0A1J5QUQ6_9ZZZZ